MLRYKQIEYKAGATVEIIKCIPAWCRKGVERGAPKKTKAEIKEANMRQAARALARKINANFKPGDLHVVLTYKRECRPDPEEAKKRLKKFIDSLRDRYRKAGFELKYVYATEYKSKSIHHHLIVNNVNDGKQTTMNYISKLWKHNGHPKYTDLYDTGEYQTLADYLIKETERTFRESPNKQRYGCSRNLIIPQPESRMREVKRSWEMDPKPREGYYILQDSLYNGFDKLGYPYQRYVMVKITPVESDWIPWSEEEAREWRKTKRMR